MLWTRQTIQPPGMIQCILIICTATRYNHHKATSREYMERPFAVDKANYTASRQDLMWSSVQPPGIIMTRLPTGNTWRDHILWTRQTIQPPGRIQFVWLSIQPPGIIMIRLPAESTWRDHMLWTRQTIQPPGRIQFSLIICSASRQDLVQSGHLYNLQV